jgi:PhnB protein
MESKPTFIPVLSIASGITDVVFYEKAFGAIESWRINNPDGSLHVAAYSINGVTFRLHEESKDGRNDSPTKAGSSTVTIALSVEDVHAVVAQAIAAGATALSPVTDYEYGYRQGEIKDPFGHLWLIEKVVDKNAFDEFIKTLILPA